MPAAAQLGGEGGDDVLQSAVTDRRHRQPRAGVHQDLHVGDPVGAPGGARCGRTAPVVVTGSAPLVAGVAAVRVAPRRRSAPTATGGVPTVGAHAGTDGAPEDRRWTPGTGTIPGMTSLDGPAAGPRHTEWTSA
ncbi:hypothetical protein GCM10028783_26920 [Modestobacter muralis]